MNQSMNSVRTDSIELPDVPIIVCYGAGIDSTAMLKELKNRGIVPDAITFADVGSEKPETYEMVKTMNRWCEQVGFPPINTCRYKTTHAPYDSLTGNCIENETLPDLAFHRNSCSTNRKQQQQDTIHKSCTAGPQQWAAHPQ